MARTRQKFAVNRHLLCCSQALAEYYPTLSQEEIGDVLTRWGYPETMQWVVHELDRLDTHVLPTRGRLPSPRRGRGLYRSTAGHVVRWGKVRRH